MNELQPFTGDESRCPKCKGEVDATWQAAGTNFVSSVPGGGFRWRLDANAPEWMVRECFGCGYSWAEATADAHVDTMFREGP